MSPVFALLKSAAPAAHQLMQIVCNIVSSECVLDGDGVNLNTDDSCMHRNGRHCK